MRRDLGSYFRNDGTLQAGSHTRIDAEVLGHGAMTFTAPTPVAQILSLIFAELELDRRVAAGQVIDMTNDGTLRLGDLAEFHGTVFGFSGPVTETVFNHAETHQDTIDLLGVNATALRYSGDSAHGTLTVLSGTTAIGNITLVGDFTATRFVLTQAGADSLIQRA